MIVSKTVACLSVAQVHATSVTEAVCDFRFQTSHRLHRSFLDNKCTSVSAGRTHCERELLTGADGAFRCLLEYRPMRPLAIICLYSSSVTAL